ncbi:hypothetical protein [Cognatiluteimonas telluris]|uniref:hypothetical protein n=1 Tax=Cognatiluteimonas telluris TaxID=1104775 RepID=UPI001408EFE2|nr:hypothetical protein [Lysobacter telluris]
MALTFSDQGGLEAQHGPERAIQVNGKIFGALLRGSGTELAELPVQGLGNVREGSS